MVYELKLKFNEMKKLNEWNVQEVIILSLM
jgi:hypothetical protein